MPTSAMLVNLSSRGRVILAASALGIVIVLYFLFQLASQPSYSTVLTNVDPAQTGKITAALDAKGIGYELQNNGTALAVEKDKTAQAHVALASAGLPGTSQPGFQLFDKQSLGASNFQQQVTYQRALEGQISQTIQQVQGVSGAQVQLVLPDPQSQLFSANQSPSTAAVLLSGSTTLDPGAVRGIAQLVSSSVPGLKTDKVTITDGTGQLLWPTADAASSGGSGPLLAKLGAETTYDQQMASAINAMLVQTLGAGKAQAQVHADLNANQANQEQLVYGPKGIPLQAHTDTEALKGGGSGTTPAGTGGNVPTYAQAGNAASNYNHKVTDDTFGVNKTVTKTTIAPGAVNSQQVSVLVDKSVPATAIPQIRAAVASAAGIQAKRGDTLSIGQVAFAPAPKATPAATPITGMLKYVKYAFIGLASLAFLVLISRHLRRREGEALGSDATWLREISSPRSLAEIERDGDTMTVTPLRGPGNPARQQVEDLVQRDPDRVAQQVRAWMQDD
jgi:flagellar M-ring protein FliF